MKELRQKLQDARNRISEAKKQIQQLEERVPTLKRQLQERSVAINTVSSEVTKATTIDAELAQQIESKTNQLLEVQSELEQLRQDVVSTLQETQRQIEEQYSSFETQLKEREVALERLASQVENDKTTVTQLSQETEARAGTVLHVQSELEELRTDIVSTLQQVEERIKEECRTFETQLQERSAALEELVSQSERDKAIGTQLVQETKGIDTTVREVQSELEQLRQDIVKTVNEIGGKEGLETLRREFQEGRELLGEIQMHRQQLQSIGNTALGTVEEQIQAHSAVQETSSRVEHMYSEVSRLAQQVRSDVEVIQTLRAENASSPYTNTPNVNPLDTSMHDLGERLDRLQNQISDVQEQLGQKLRSLEQKGQGYNKILILFCVGLAVVLAIALLRK
ncbi:MAG: hypothetical protein NVS2B14_02580 [Chamaesiphon sp.]